MKSRRRRQASDSLDLLLDTICNTFGGILFIALLVVILLQLQGEQSEATPAQQVTSADLADLRNQLNGRIDGLERLRALLDGQRRTLATLAPAELATLVAQHAAANEIHDLQQRQREELLQRTAELAESIERTDEELRTTAADLETAEAAVASLEGQLSEHRESRRQELRTPVQRTLYGKREVGCVLQYGRFYVWHRYDRSGERMGLNTAEFIVLEDEAEGLFSTPRPTKGTPVEDTASCRAKLAARLAAFPPGDCYIAVVTRPDSFAEWAILRNLLAAEGFEYRLLPLNDGEPIADRGGTGSRVQ